MKDWKYHCSVLGLREGASQKDVRRAYRRLALERHPDKHNNSAQSTEDFQQLHESYEFLLGTLAGGGPPPPAAARPAPPPPDPRVDRDAPTDPGLRAPRRHVAVAVPEKSQWKMWLQMTGVAVVLLAISVGAELFHQDSPSRSRAPADLAARSWCLIKGDKETFNYETESACHARCDAGTPVSCAWSSVVFRGRAEKAAPAAAPAPVRAEPEVLCQVTMEHEAGKPVTTSYDHQTETSCARTCLSKADLDPRAGVHCQADGKPLFARERSFPAPDSAPTPKAYTEIALAPLPDQLATTCYLTSLSEGSTVAEKFPGDTASACAQRCDRIIKEHPLDHVVRCSYAGAEIVTYVPDGTMAYLARNPAEESAGVRQGAELQSNCEIYGSRGDVRTKVRAFLASHKDCEDGCRSELAQAPKGSALQCIFAGKEFLRLDAL